MGRQKSPKVWSRRTILELGALNTMMMLACRRPPVGATSALNNAHESDPEALSPLGFGPLLVDANGFLDLPHGFSAVILQRSGDTMSCGNRMPAQPDGMTCHVDDQGNYVLLRNHELSDAAWMKQRGLNLSTDIFSGGRHPALAYDEKVFGGVTRLVVDPALLGAALIAGEGALGAVLRSNLVLAGTEFNCSGGHVPEGWISCEETDREGHGYAFLTRIEDDKLVDPAERRITSWGRFKREGVSVVPGTGVVFMTEDHANGSLYRFVAAEPDLPMGEGRLQAMVVDGVANTDPETPLVSGDSWPVRWVEVDDPQASNAPCREQGQAKGASRFNRCEGSVWDGVSLWFIASTAGPVGAGQVFRYDPVSERLHLVVQVTDRSVLSMPDNVCLAPWGDLVMAEDNYNAGGGATHQYIRGLRSDGTVYDLARNPKNTPDDCGAEFTGPCFSPDGKYLFLNMQTPSNVTIAIRGPWKHT
jgi:secreted PhoX family phosphatase